MGKKKATKVDEPVVGPTNAVDEDHEPSGKEIALLQQLEGISREIRQEEAEKKQVMGEFNEEIKKKVASRDALLDALEKEHSPGTRDLPFYGDESGDDADYAADASEM